MTTTLTPVAPAAATDARAADAPPAPARAVTTTYREAVKRGIRAALAREPRAFLMGEDVGAYGGCYACSKGLLAELGPARIRDVPLSEQAFVGAGVGAAIGGARPIVEVMTPRRCGTCRAAR